jgi:uncharacterized radical SAM superfamily protein
MTAKAATSRVTNWLDIISGIEALEDIAINEALVSQLECVDDQNPANRSIRFHNPGFKSCQTTELGGCNPHSWPAVSITGGHCQLQCEHCQAKILEPMLPATTPDALWRLVNDQIERGAQGMLLTGGSDHRNEIHYQPFWPVVQRLKAHYPWFEIACHTALVDDDNAQRMADAGVDVAMMDIIGARDTIRRVYHLKREVADFADSLASLCRTAMRVVPHIVLGLHFGKLLGEWQALEIIQQHPVDAVVLVTVMPHFAGRRFQSQALDASTIGRFVQHARQQLPAVPLSLGCARPAGPIKTEIDIYAVLAGVDRIAHPSEGIVQLSRQIGREVMVSQACCSLSPERERRKCLIRHYQ